MTIFWTGYNMEQIQLLEMYFDRLAKAAFYRHNSHCAWLVIDFLHKENKSNKQEPSHKKGLIHISWSSFSFISFFRLADLPTPAAGLDVIMPTCSEKQFRDKEKMCSHRFLEKAMQHGVNCRWVWWLADILSTSSTLTLFLVPVVAAACYWCFFVFVFFIHCSFCVLNRNVRGYIHF